MCIISFFALVLFGIFSSYDCFNSKLFLQRRAEENELNLNETFLNVSLSHFCFLFKVGCFFVYKVLINRVADAPGLPPSEETPQWSKEHKILYTHLILNSKSLSDFVKEIHWFLVFPTLKNYHVNGVEVTESDYPWIARVVHSRNNFVPVLCTAICIDESIFITAARCVYILKVVYTSVIYQNQRLTAKAFVLPSKESKQLYDDIGFIIVNKEFTGNWKNVETFNEKRPDNVFKWFENMKFNEYGYKVVGYAMEKESKIEPIWKRAVKLMELEVVVDIRLCREILSYNNIINGFNVPCYHSCSYNSHVDEDDRCDNYLGVLGGALMNIKSNKLFGIATWAAYYKYFELPVGFAVPNSDSYFEDLACSLKIRNSQETNASEGFYQSLCDDNRKYEQLFKDKDYFDTEKNWQNFLY